MNQQEKETIEKLNKETEELTISDFINLLRKSKKENYTGDTIEVSQQKEEHNWEIKESIHFFETFKDMTEPETKISDIINQSKEINATNSKTRMATNSLISLAMLGAVSVFPAALPVSATYLAITTIPELLLKKVRNSGLKDLELAVSNPERIGNDPLSRSSLRKIKSATEEYLKNIQKQKHKEAKKIGRNPN